MNSRDYLRAARIKKVRRYTLAQRLLLLTLIAVLVEALVILYAR